MSPAVATFDVRQALLDAAGVELSERGCAGLSLRAVARRAGVSHAAPKHHFGDRAGLLTAVAAQGFHDLADALSSVSGADTAATLTLLGATYFDFAHARPALFEVMFTPAELHPEDADLNAARGRAIAILANLSDTPRSDPELALAPLTLISWALVHGLCVLSRDGALPTPTHTGPVDAAHSLLRAYAHHIDVDALSRRGNP